MKTLSERLRYAWQQSGLSQTHIASECGISRAAVSQWMPENPTDAGAPTRDNLVCFARVTGFRLDWLLTGQEPKLGAEETAARYRGARPDPKLLASVLAYLGEKLPPSKLGVSWQEWAELAVKMYDVLRPDGTIDTAKMLDVIIQPTIEKHHDARKRKARIR